MQQLHLDSPVTALRGIKSVRAAQLEKLGIRTLYDLIAYFPRAYEDRTHMVDIARLEANVPACFEAMVVSAPRTARIRKGLELTKLTVADSSGKLNLTFFNQSYVAGNLHYGESYRFFGTLQDDGYRQMTNPVFEPEHAAGNVTGRLFPVYSLTAGLSNAVLQKAIRQALDACLEHLPEILPAELRRTHHLCDAAYAYEAIHAPLNNEVLEQARRRLVFEEFFIFSAGLSRLRGSRQNTHCAPYDTSCIKRFTDALSFRLTGAQTRAIDEVLRDVSSGTPMNRLLQGDVGSGKTMVAAAAAFCAIENGKQAALLVPTEVLAEQHMASLNTLFSGFGIRTELLTGCVPAAEKRRIKQAISDGQADLVIGTHALMTDDVVFHDLGLIIADEQHRFGVAQRASLLAKGTNPHLLVMSATPIPRTLALIAYGDLQISILDELPPGRQKIDTFLVGEDMRRRINAFIRKQCDDGGQVYIVCPAVEESELESLKSAEVWAQTLQQTVFPDLRVGLLHGRMNAAEKEAVMRAFSDHALDILVSTTVIEVGIDVPNANLIVVENADRFGLSQLHQLRGRVGRGSRKSYCVLFSSSKNPDTQQRLKALVSTNDGFKIAEMDLSMRGPGDFFGSRQHGLPQLKVANMLMDMQTLQQAQQAAQALLSAPDWMDDPAYAPLCRRIDALFCERTVTLN